MQPSGQQRTNPDTNRSTRFERLLNGSVGNENIRLTPRALSSLDLSTGDEGVPTTTFGQAVASYFNRLTKSFWTRRRASDDHNQANGEDGLEMETWPPSGTQLRHQHTPSSDTDTSFASESRDGFSDLSSKRSSNTIYEDLNESIQTYDKDERSGTTTFPPIADSSAGATSKQTQQAIDSYSSNSVDDNSFSVASTDSNSDFERYNQPTPEAEQEITRWGTCPAIVHPKSTNGKGKRREAIVQLDTGSHYDAIAGSCADKLGLKRELENTFVQSFNGEYIMLKEFVLLVIEIDGRGFQRKLLVVEGEPGWDILFGRGTTMERGLLSKTGRLSRSMNVIGRVNPDKLRPGALNQLPTLRRQPLTAELQTKKPRIKSTEMMPRDDQTKTKKRFSSSTNKTTCTELGLGLGLALDKQVGTERGVRMKQKRRKADDDISKHA
jgi:hypothetical protein